MRKFPDWFPLAILGLLYLAAAGIAPPIEMLMGIAK